MMAGNQLARGSRNRSSNIGNIFFAGSVLRRVLREGLAAGLLQYTEPF
jgi:hypothetical protein